MAAGMAAGMAATILILAWIHHEWMYDRFYPKTKQLFIAFDRATANGKVHCWKWTPRILAPALKTDNPEIAAAARMEEATALYADKEAMFKINWGMERKLGRKQHTNLC